jgi:hypothetical protein
MLNNGLEINSTPPFSPLEAILKRTNFKEQDTVVYINWPKNFLGVKCALIKP